MFLTDRRAAVVIGGLVAMDVIGVIVLVIVLGFPSFLLIFPLAIIGVVTTIRPWWGITALAALLPLNGLASDLLVAAGRTDTALLVGAAKDVVLAALVVASFTTGRFRRVRRDLLVIVGGLLLIGAVAAIWTPNLEQAAYGWRNDFEPLVLLLCVPLFVTEHVSRRIVLALAIGAQVASLVAVTTWALGVSWVYTIGRLPVPDGQVFPASLFVAGSKWPRAFSPFSGPNELAVAMAFAIAVILCQRQWKWRVRAMLSVGPIVAVLLAQSRSGQIGVIAAVAVVAVWALWRVSKVWAIAFFGLVGVVGTIGAIYYASLHQGADADPSLGGHADSLTRSIALIVDRPFGYGLGQVGPRAVRYMSDSIQVESFWLLLGLEAGILALVLFVTLLVRLVQISLRARTLGAFTITAVLAASLVSQLVLPTLQDTTVAYLLWISVGIGLQAAGHLRPPPTTGPKTSPIGSPTGRAITRASTNIRGWKDDYNKPRRHSTTG